MKLHAKLRFVRSTKNTHRYDEVAAVPILGQLYVQKHAMPQPAEELDITIKLVSKLDAMIAGREETSNV